MSLTANIFFSNPHKNRSTHAHAHGSSRGLNAQMRHKLYPVPHWPPASLCGLMTLYRIQLGWMHQVLYNRVIAICMVMQCNAKRTFSSGSLAALGNSFVQTYWQLDISPGCCLSLSGWDSIRRCAPCIYILQANLKMLSHYNIYTRTIDTLLHWWLADFYLIDWAREGGGKKQGSEG